jgi:site-specific recombinase
VLDQATRQAIQLVSGYERTRLTTTHHRMLRKLASEASEESLRDYWPEIWGEFAENFDPR